MANHAATNFMDARFGMFIHWGLYSLLAGEWQGRRMEDDLAEWIMSYFRIPIEQYEQLAQKFNPVHFDADAIVRLALAAGMNYLVITSKHHDGFALFHSRVDAYNVVDATPFARDIIKELAESCQKHGLQFGVYYSQALDWHEKNAGGWDDPAYLPKRRPWANIWDFPSNKGKDFTEYFNRKVLPQVTELLTNYGDIFLLWFDTPRTISAEQSRELYDLVKRLQPDCLVNSRIGNGMGDYSSLGDNQLPVIPLKVPAESPVTLNDTWAYKWFDNNWKESPAIIARLARLAGKNANLLLNIGPRGDGSIPEDTARILHETGQWTRRYGEAIFSTKGNPHVHDFDWGSCTSAQNNLYCLIEDGGKDNLMLNGLNSQVLAINKLPDRKKCAFSQKTIQGESSLTIQLQAQAEAWPVYQIELARPARFSPTIMSQDQGDIYLYPHLAQAKLAGKNSMIKSHGLGDRYKKITQAAISSAGTLVGWKNKALSLVWEFKVLFTKPYAFFLALPEYYGQAEDRLDHKMLLTITNATNGSRQKVQWDHVRKNGSTAGRAQLFLPVGIYVAELTVVELVLEEAMELKNIVISPLEQAD